MTSTSGNREPGYIDLEAYGLVEVRLYSLKALAEMWRQALATIAAETLGCPPDDEFVQISAELPTSIANLRWQKSWLQAWQGLSSRGVTMREVALFFFVALEYCERDLFAGKQQVAALNLELFSNLRRAVAASMSCALELSEEVREANGDVPGELTALRVLHDLHREHEQIAVLSLSLINRNSFVHLAASDLQSLPATIAQRLQALLHPRDKVFLGREGEWLLVMPGIRSMAQPSLAAAHIQRVFAEPIRLLSGRSLMLDVAIGAAMMPAHGQDADTVIHSARLARWSLTANGQGFGWFDESMNQDWRHRFKLSEELRQALQHELLALYLQPQVDMSTNQCVGAELLLRWRRENGEWVPPPIIMELIEENGWRASLSDWLVREAMRIIAELRAAGVAISVSLNLTAADMRDEDLPEMIAQRLETWQIPPGSLTLELTESAMLADRERSLATMHRLRALGIKLALDDFGTGYSSLSYLVSLPLHEIKIDRAFIVAMSESQESLRLVRTIIDLTRDLEMVPLAEGVETQAQRDQLLALGCSMAQGFYYAKALPLTEFIAWYRERQA